jgi:exosome complex component RRP42
MSESIISNIQKNRIIEYLNQGKRFDNRKPNEFRDIKVELGISNKAEGSCSVKIGNTEVYAGVKLEIAQPYPDTPKEGNFMTSVELSPMASQEFELGPPKIDAIELGRVIDRGLRESGFIDFEKLCIKEGEKVWQIFLDIYAINDDGNLLDVAGIAGLIALANTKLPVYNEETGKLDREVELTNNPLPLEKDFMGLNLTIYKIGNAFVVDPNIDEQKSASYRISLAISSNNGEPRISSCQKGQEDSIGYEEFSKLMDFLEETWKDFYPKISKLVWENK